MTTKRAHSDLGFTLVELIIVIALIGVLSALALPKFANLKSASEVNFVNGVINALTIGRERWRSAWTVVNSVYNIDSFNAYYVSLPLTSSQATQWEYLLIFNANGYPTGSPIAGDSAAVISTSQGITYYTIAANYANRVLTTPSVASVASDDQIAVICARIFFNLINNPNISVGHKSSSLTSDFLYDSTCNVANTPSTKSTFCVVPGAGFSTTTQCYYQYQGNTAIYILYTPIDGKIRYNG